MKPWGGRFSGDTDPLLERFSASIEFDRLLYRYDIEGSKAHAAMLGKIGLLSEEEAKAISVALDEIKGEIEEGSFVFTDALEDIHMHVEARLIEKIGDAGKKLHTGRSRNDQVALDIRMYLRDQFSEIGQGLMGMMRALVERAEGEQRTIMPGYTHLQRAQVITFAHFLMAYYQMFKRDRERLRHMAGAVEILPLGCGALAGSTIPLDREFVRDKLGFAGVSENSLDTVSDRDFVVDAIYGAAMTMVHLSRMAEDLILFSTEEFHFVSLPDRLCTGSSLMPHKKNPDALELIRGKTGRVLGDLFSLFTTLKGLPLAYNRDLQEDKEPLFHAMGTVKDAISIMELCVRGLAVNRGRMEEAVYGSFMPATEMAEYLTLRGLPFREAHGIVGRLVRDCVEKKRSLREMNIEEMKSYSSLFGEDIFEHMDPFRILAERRTTGGASFSEVERQIEAEKKYLNT
jgi:argininosuccinate lyase